MKTTEVRHTHLHIHVCRHSLYIGPTMFTLDLLWKASLLSLTTCTIESTLAGKLPPHEKACLTGLAQNIRKFRSWDSQNSDHKTHTEMMRPPWIVHNRTHKRYETTLYKIAHCLEGGLLQEIDFFAITVDVHVCHTHINTEGCAMCTANYHWATHTYVQEHT